MTCPCNGALAGGPFSCLACKRKAQANPGGDRTKHVANSNVKTKGGPFPSQTDSVRGLSVASMQGSRVVRAYQGRALPDTRHLTFDPNVADVVRGALHESAHAIISQVLGCRVKRIHAGPIRGFVEHAVPDNPRFELAIKLAGAVGEALVILPENAPARPLGGQDALDVACVLDALGLQGEARGKAVNAVADFVRSCLVAHAEAWDALTVRLIHAPMLPLEGAVARKIMATGDPMATSA